MSQCESYCFGDSGPIAYRDELAQASLGPEAHVLAHAFEASEARDVGFEPTPSWPWLRILGMGCHASI